MSEVKPIRLIKAAKTLNVGTETIVEFLKSKDFEVENKPTTKLTPEMYTELLREFRGEVDLKEEAEQVELGSKAKNVKIEIGADGTRKEVVEEDEEETAEETPEEPDTKKVELSGPKVVGKIDIGEKKTEDESTEEDAPSEEVAEEDAADTPSEEESTSTEAPAAEKDADDAEAPDEAKKPKEKKEEDFIKTQKVELSGPKILGKIEIKEDRRDGEKRKRKRVRKSAKIDPRKGGGPGGRKGKDEKQVVSEKEIEEKLKQTMAKLQAAQGGKSQRQKVRRAKRQDMHEAQAEREAATGEDGKLKVTEFISVSELASLLDVEPTEIIKKAFMLGVMVSINQRLDAELIELIVSEYDREVEFISASDTDVFADTEDDPEDLEPRAPVVTIMGHVDHGKTSLLDYIREASVASGEAGGITQHIGAYEVETERGNISFLDTPGHEAFTAMRARGAKLTDVAIIVIAADDNIMPQTKEAISHAQSAGVPMIFAINKIDKPGANPEKIKEELAAMDLLVEDWGGKYQSQDISAKTGQNVDELLEKIILEAELLELKANAKKDGIGAVIEASLDKGRGYVATLLVENGSLNHGDFVVAGPYSGKVKAMFDHTGQKITEAGPAQPVQILGLDGAPQAGEKFKVFGSEQDGKQVATRREQLEREQGIRTQKHITLDEIGRRLALGTFKELNIIIKGDVDGSIEALSDSLLKLSTEEIQVNVLHKAVGAVSESDIMLASASDAIIIGFQVRPTVKARQLAETEGVEIRLYSVIYNAIEEIKAAMEGMLEPTIEETITANLEVLDIFKITKVGTVAGCTVVDGKIRRTNKVRVVRDGIVVYDGELGSLKRYKDEVKEVVSGQECGLNIKNFNDVKVGDEIEAYEETEVQRTL